MKKFNLRVAFLIFLTATSAFSDQQSEMPQQTPVTILREAHGILNELEKIENQRQARAGLVDQRNHARESRNNLEQQLAMTEAQLKAALPTAQEAKRHELSALIIKTKQNIQFTSELIESLQNKIDHTQNNEQLDAKKSALISKRDFLYSQLSSDHMQALLRDNIDFRLRQIALDKARIQDLENNLKDGEQVRVAIGTTAFSAPGFEGLFIAMALGGKKIAQRRGGWIGAVALPVFYSAYFGKYFYDQGVINKAKSELAAREILLVQLKAIQK